MAKPTRQYVVTGINSCGHRWREVFTVKREAERTMLAERALINRWLRDGVLPKDELRRSLRALRMTIKEARRG